MTSELLNKLNNYMNDVYCIADTTNIKILKHYLVKCIKTPEKMHLYRFVVEDSKIIYEFKYLVVNENFENGTFSMLKHSQFCGSNSCDRYNCYDN